MVKQFAEGTRVSFLTYDVDGNLITLYGTVFRSNWGRSGQNVSIKTDSRSIFTRLASEITEVSS